MKEEVEEEVEEVEDEKKKEGVEEEEKERRTDEMGQRMAEGERKRLAGWPGTVSCLYSRLPPFGPSFATLSPRRLLFFSSPSSRFFSRFSPPVGSLFLFLTFLLKCVLNFG